MLGQRLETSLKSQTLPRLDGQDEEGEVLENQFEILSIVNSCPDLTVLEAETNLNDDVHNLTRTCPVSHGDVVDGIGFKTLISSVTSGSFRRSTSLSSLGVENVDASHNDHENNNGPVANVLQAGRVGKVVGNLEKALKKEGSSHLTSTDFVRTGLRASHGGTTVGYLHKSISSPSVTQYFVSSAGGPVDNYQKPQVRVQSDAHQHSSKRSFFRRKHKSKSNLINSHPPTALRYPNRMDGMSERGMSSMNGESTTNSLAFAALHDPSLGLQDADAECWALSMSPDLVSRLEDKEVKRQEHMYELILTEKHHCLTLALMQHLFVRDMKKFGFSRYARLLFPELNKLLEVHFEFLRRMRERQQKFYELEQPMDTLSDILVEQFTTEQYHLMIRLYGLLCASHTKSLDIFRALMKDPKFASLVATWDKESLLGRKNVRECLLLVAQRITKYPLLIEPILKTSLNASPQEKEEIEKALRCSKDLISKVDHRVAERQRLLEFCNRIDPKSFVTMGQRRRGRDDIMSLPSRRLLFHGQVIVNGNRSSNSGGGAPVSRNNIPCSLTILTDSLVFTQEISLKYHFVSPPGIVMLNNLIVRENAGQNLSLFLVLGTGTSKPEMIDFKVVNPPNRKIWLDAIRNAITKCVEETETGSDVDEEVDAVDLSDLKTTKALEELQEQDKQLLSTLRSRARLIDSLRLEKPYHWLPSNFEGKDSVLNSLSSTCSEVQRIISLWEDNANNSVIRSASCVGENGAQGALLGLPKRADTFGGFDSQQRSALELPPCTNNKLLMEMVIRLSQLCGEMFSQMIPQLLPSVYQTHHQLQRRMEDLREAQQRLETEKALFQQELISRKESIERERAELTNLKMALQKEQEDITQQREQLYRKLEALQKQGIRPPMDPISPLSGTTNVEKPPTNPAPNRRPLPQTTPPISSAPINNQPSNGLKNKQQLPLFLASTSSFKAGKTGGNVSSSEVTPSVMRNSVMGSFKGSSAGVNVSQSAYPTVHDPGRQVSKGSNAARTASTQQVQQMLPLRLSEGNANKTSSLPRGIGSRSVSSMDQMEQNPQSSNSNHQIRSSASTAAFPYTGISNPSMSSNSSFLYGPVQNSARRQYMDANMVQRNGHNDDHVSTEAISIVHRRSGSSPVPLSGVQQPPRRAPAPEIHYHQHQHPFFRQRDDDSEKILFL